MELNGVANLHLLVDELFDQLGDAVTREVKKTLGDIKDQLDVLERYMLAIQEAHNQANPTPAWHEVRDSRELFPTNSERFKRAGY